MDSIYSNTPKTGITKNSKTSGSKVLFEDLSRGHLGFMQIIRVSQSCRLGSQVKFVPGCQMKSPLIYHVAMNCGCIERADPLKVFT